MLLLLVMNAGDGLEEHSAPGLISLIVREGIARFAAGGETVEAGSEIVSACDAGARPAVEVPSDAACPLNIVGQRATAPP